MGLIAAGRIAASDRPRRQFARGLQVDVARPTYRVGAGEGVRIVTQGLCRGALRLRPAVVPVSLGMATAASVPGVSWPSARNPPRTVRLVECIRRTAKGSEACAAATSGCQLVDPSRS
ncbi:hypothetical protein GCM10018966_071340 [Streptomyces yanii]